MLFSDIIRTVDEVGRLPEWLVTITEKWKDVDPEHEEHILVYMFRVSAPTKVRAQQEAEFLLAQPELYDQPPEGVDVIQSECVVTLL